MPWGFLFVACRSLFHPMTRHLNRVVTCFSHPLNTFAGKQIIKIISQDENIISKDEDI